MKKFAFPLERSRAWRRTLWDREQHHLDRLLAELQSLGFRRAQLSAVVTGSARTIACRPVLTSRDLQELDHIQHYGSEEDRRLADRARLAEAEIQRQRTAVLAARRQFEILDQLRDQQFQAWNRDLAREQETEVSDLTIARWKRSDSGP